MPNPLSQRIYRALRITAATLATILLALFLFVQFQQHLLRHRAEQLNADIAALRDNPATWTDLQRIQHRWGAHAHYDGPCNPTHCDYIIRIGDIFDGQHIVNAPLWLLKAYIRLGGRPSWVIAELRLTQNHLWGYRFYLTTGITSMERGIGDGFLLGADTTFGPRLFSWPHQRDIGLEVFRNRYRIGQPSRCMFCVEKWLIMTPLTPKTDRDRLAIINFSCLTRFHPCASAADILPNVAAQEAADESSPQHLTDSRDAYSDPRCEVPPHSRATEADNIMVVDILTSEAMRYADGKLGGYLVTAKIIEPLKNAFVFHAGAIARFYADDSRLIPPPGASPTAAVHPLSNSKRYIVLFPDLYGIDSGRPEMHECAIVPDAPSSRSEIAKGISGDPSTGEKYNPEY